MDFATARPQYIRESCCFGWERRGMLVSRGGARRRRVRVGMLPLAARCLLLAVGPEYCGTWAHARLQAVLFCRPVVVALGWNARALADPSCFAAVSPLASPTMILRGFGVTSYATCAMYPLPCLSPPFHPLTIIFSLFTVNRVVLMPWACSLFLSRPFSLHDQPAACRRLRRRRRDTRTTTVFTLERRTGSTASPPCRGSWPGAACSTP